MEYFKAASKFLQEKYGKENCVGAYVHMDEKTPHMHFVFVPMTKDRRLSSKEINSRGNLTRLQNELPKHLQRNGFNVRRGEMNSPQQHVDTADWKRDEKILNETKAALVKIVNPEHEKEKRLGFFGDTGNVILSQDDFKKLQQRQMELDEREKQLDSRDGQLLLQKAKEYVEKIPDLPEVKMKLDRLATEQLKKENPERYKQLRGYYAKKVRTETLDLQKERQGKGVKRP